ncbi:MAG: hypothetical protein KVP17_003962 [Porospora cf. gigantea B]|uniref:uncharacterized protein n=1 Tax=Porospora cf. gigantea B TaxID=2853592 RepID=UPI003571A250|nr:MAG: hypothetical protein KVP17_003962 [Porospora cf. gigantea B]
MEHVPLINQSLRALFGNDNASPQEIERANGILVSWQRNPGSFALSLEILTQSLDANTGGMLPNASVGGEAVTDNLVYFLSQTVATHCKNGRQTGKVTDVVIAGRHLPPVSRHQLARALSAEITLFLSTGPEQSMDAVTPDDVLLYRQSDSPIPGMLIPATLLQIRSSPLLWDVAYELPLCLVNKQVVLEPSGRGRAFMEMAAVLVDVFELLASDLQALQAPDTALKAVAAWLRLHLALFGADDNLLLQNSLVSILPPFMALAAAHLTPDAAALGEAKELLGVLGTLAHLSTSTLSPLVPQLMTALSVFTKSIDVDNCTDDAFDLYLDLWSHLAAEVFPRCVAMDLFVPDIREGLDLALNVLALPGASDELKTAALDAVDMACCWIGGDDPSVLRRVMEYLVRAITLPVDLDGQPLYDIVAMMKLRARLPRLILEISSIMPDFDEVVLNIINNVTQEVKELDDKAYSTRWNVVEAQVCFIRLLCARHMQTDADQLLMPLLHCAAKPLSTYPFSGLVWRRTTAELIQLVVKSVETPKDLHQFAMLLMEWIQDVLRHTNTALIGQWRQSRANIVGDDAKLPPVESFRSTSVIMSLIVTLGEVVTDSPAVPMLSDPMLIELMQALQQLLDLQGLVLPQKQGILSNTVFVANSLSEEVGWDLLRDLHTTLTRNVVDLYNDPAEVASYREGDDRLHDKGLDEMSPLLVAMKMLVHLWRLLGLTHRSMDEGPVLDMIQDTLMTVGPIYFGLRSDNATDMICTAIPEVMGLDRQEVVARPLFAMFGQMLQEDFLHNPTVFHLSAIRSLVGQFGAVPDACNVLATCLEAVQTKVVTALNQADSHLTALNPDIVGMTIDTLRAALSSPYLTRALLNYHSFGGLIMFCIRDCTKRTHVKVKMCEMLLLAGFVGWLNPDEYEKVAERMGRSVVMSSLTECSQKALEISQSTGVHMQIARVLFETCLTEFHGNQDWLSIAARVIFILMRNPSLAAETEQELSRTLEEMKLPRIALFDEILAAASLRECTAKLRLFVDSVEAHTKRITA